MKGIWTRHHFRGFAFLHWRQENVCSMDSSVFSSWGAKILYNQCFAPFCFLDWRKEYAQLIDSFVLFISIQERNLQISSILRFGFLRLKEVMWVTHDLFGFESLNWRKERMYARVSSVLLPEIDKRNMCNLWLYQFWFLSAGSSSVFFP